MVKAMSTAGSNNKGSSSNSNRNSSNSTSNIRTSSNNNNSGGGGGGPCGACKFLRRKCVKGCIFEPYFDSEQGAAHFAAVHKVFGASNVSKLLLRIPVHKRLDAVVTICYEALARIKDPVYGCVAHIFALQQQVVNLQSELAFVQAHLSTLELSSSQSMLFSAQSPELPTLHASSNMDSSACSTEAAHLIPFQPQHSLYTVNCCSGDGINGDGDLQELAKDFVSKYLTGVRFRPSTS